MNYKLFSDTVSIAVAKLYYQEGFPIAMAIQILEQRGIAYDINVIARTLMANGWSEKTVRRKLSEDFADSGEKIKELDI